MVRIIRTVLIRGGIVAITALVTLILVACDFARETSPYPPYFPYVVDQIDLSASLPTAVREARIDATAYPGNGRRYFALLARPDSASDDVVVIIDDSFSVLLIEESTGVLEFDTSLFVSNTDNIQLGNLSYNPATGVVSNVVRPENVYDPIAHHPSDYVVFTVDGGTNVRMQRWDTSWIASVAGDTVTQGFSDNRTIRSVTATYKFNGGATPSDLSVFVQDDAGRTYRRTVAWETLNLAAPGFTSWIDLTTSPPAYPELDFSTLQDTPAGILVAAGNGDHLLRIDATTGAERGRFTPGRNPRSDDEYPIAFDPAGAFYLLLDTETRILYKVAPWW